MNETENPDGAVVHEIVGADIPPQPPVGTAVIDAEGRLFQLTRWYSLFDGVSLGSRVEWSGVGERRRQHRPSWVELLNRGPVTVVWRPTSEEAEVTL
jgi:hypothetical protein